MKPDFSCRADLQELMDGPEIEPVEMRETLLQLEDINRKLGGYGPSRDGVRRLLPADRRAFSLLDVGTGGGDFARHISSWSRQRGLDANVHAIDVSPTILELARSMTSGGFSCESLSFEAVDLLDLEGEDRFDIVHAGLLLHHFTGAAAEQALAKMLSLSRWGVIVNDIHRHALAYHAISLLTRLRWRNRLIRNDAPISVLRAFRRRELTDLCRGLSIHKVRIRWCWAFRWQMVLWKRESASEFGES